MDTKTAYQFDAAGLYAGTTDADESPMEPGHFLLPGRCTFTPPPEDMPDEKWPRWNGTAWSLVNRPGPASAQNENPLAKLQAFLIANPDVASIVNNGG